MKLIASVIATIAFITPAMAQNHVSTAAEKESPKQICVSQIVTGSMMRKRVCRTQAEIDAAAAQGRKDAQTDRDLQNNRAFAQSKPTGN